MDAETTPDMTEQIRSKCRDIETMLIEKNMLYGNSALYPMRIFSCASAEEQLLVRIDDKLSRLINMGIKQRVATNEFHEDTILDLIGYLILLLVSQEMK